MFNPIIYWILEKSTLLTDYMYIVSKKFNIIAEIGMLDKNSISQLISKKYFPPIIIMYNRYKCLIIVCNQV